jgi:ribosomal protein L11 methyltransferase
MPYVVLSVEVARDAVDWVQMIVGASAFRDDVLVVQPTADDAHPWVYTVQVFVPAAAFREAAAAHLDRELASLRKAGMVGDLFVETAAHLPATEATSDAQRIGARWVVLGPDAAVPRPDDLVVRLLPGAAWGTGVHPTTRACLALLLRHVTPGMDALDLGSGTGILSVALARLGARVVALDNDPVAVRATEANVALNSVEDRVTVAAGSLHAGAALGHWMGGAEAVAASPVAPEHRFDLVVANVFARIHAALIPDYRRVLRDDGILIIAGFTTDYADDLTAQLADAGFALLDREGEGEWVALVLQRLGA